MLIRCFILALRLIPGRKRYGMSQTRAVAVKTKRPPRHHFLVARDGPTAVVVVLIDTTISRPTHGSPLATTTFARYLRPVNRCPSVPAPRPQQVINIHPSVNGINSSANANSVHHMVSQQHCTLIFLYIIAFYCTQINSAPHVNELSRRDARLVLSSLLVPPIVPNKRATGTIPSIDQSDADLRVIGVILWGILGILKGHTQHKNHFVSIRLQCQIILARYYGHMK